MLYEVITGLIWGENFEDKEKKPSRWEDLNARVRFDYPDDWTHRPDGRAVVGTPEDKSAMLAMEPMARTAQEPEEYLYNYLVITSYSIHYTKLYEPHVAVFKG